MKLESNRSSFYRFLAQTSGNPIGLEVDKASGIFLYDTDGKEYFDLISGISVSNLGHGNPEVVRAIQDQVSRHMHLMVYGEYVQSPQVELARMLCSVLPDCLDNVYFTNSGSEAVEGALKLAKRFSGRTEMVGFQHAYHGHTHGALSMMGEETWKRKYRPLLPDVTLLEFNNIYQIQRITSQTACVLVEPLQGEAGVITPVSGFLEALRHRCTETGALLIFDEVQTGMGRTGVLFAFQKYQVIPDILVLAKALGAGMPLGAFIASKEIMSVLMDHPPLGHITTFGGHPVSCAAGLAGLKVLLREKLWLQAEKKAEIFRDALAGISLIKEIRSAGLLMAVELPDENSVQKLIARCFGQGLVLDWFLFRPTAVRIAPPLIITEEQTEKACQVLVDEIRKI